jgi:hypothetical protein
MSELVSELRATIDLLKHQLEVREREIKELHILLGEAQAKMLPQGREIWGTKPWWKFWKR